jgi:hypothetical protein
MAGELLARYFGHDLEEIVKSLTLNENIAAYSEILIIILPMILTAVILKGTMKKRHMLWQIIPLSITGVVFAAFVLPILPTDVQELVSQLDVGAYLLKLDSAVVAVVVCVQLITLWIQHRLAHHKEEKQKKNKHK